MQKNILILSLLTFTCTAMEVGKPPFSTTPAEIDVEILCRLVLKNAGSEQSVVAITALKNTMLTCKKLYKAGDSKKVTDYFMQHIAYLETPWPVYMQKIRWECKIHNPSLDDIYTLAQIGFGPDPSFHKHLFPHNKQYFAALNINTASARRWITRALEGYSIDPRAVLLTATLYNRHTLITQLLKTIRVVADKDTRRTGAEHSAALRLAVECGHVEAAQALLACPHVNVNETNPEGESMFATALENGDSKMIQLLSRDERTNLTSIPVPESRRNPTEVIPTKHCHAVEYIEKYCTPITHTPEDPRGTPRCTIDKETQDFVRKQVIKRNKVICAIQ